MQGGRGRGRSECRMQRGGSQQSPGEPSGAEPGWKERVVQDGAGNPPGQTPQGISCCFSHVWSLALHRAGSLPGPGPPKCTRCPPRPYLPAPRASCLLASLLPWASRRLWQLGRAHGGSCSCTVFVKIRVELQLLMALCLQLGNGQHLLFFPSIAQEGTVLPLHPRGWALCLPFCMPIPAPSMLCKASKVSKCAFLLWGKAVHTTSRQQQKRGARVFLLCNLVGKGPPGAQSPGSAASSS